MLIDIITQSNSTEVPGRPSQAELRAMALRQQQQIDSQHQLLAAKEQRLRFLKAQEVRGAAAAAEGERLRRLRERVEAQESKLRRLRALRGQVDLQKTYNVTLSNDLDSIRALFSEKEKELSVAVAKVEALTRQLEELRRDRRGPFNLIQGHGCQQLPNPAARELEKLRRELMYRNQLSLQQDARLHLQREALQQRQAELRSVDQRILELQTRLQRKKASNLILQSQQQHQQSNSSPQISPSVLNTNQKHSQENQNPEQKQQQQQHQQQSPRTSNIPLNGNRPSNNVYPSQRIVSRGNVAAVEPYIHTPQKSQQIKPQANKHAAATANTNQQNQLIQDFTNLKLNTNLGYVSGSNHISVNHLTYGESDESKLARQKLIVKSVLKTHSPTSKESDDSETKQSHKQEPPKTLLSYSSKIPKATSILKPEEKKEEEEKPILKQKGNIQIPSGNLVVPPRKPISSVAPTSVTSSIPKIVAQSPKVNKVAPNVVTYSETDKVRPALPPKPSKTSPNTHDLHSAIPTVVSVINKAPIQEPEPSSSPSSTTSPPITDNLPIKAKPLTIRKQPLCEQPRRKSTSTAPSLLKPSLVPYNARRIEIPPPYQSSGESKTELITTSKSSPEPSPLNTSNSTDETDKSTNSSVISEEPSIEEVKKSSKGKAKLARRVSFDPLALLLDASLEGELELVKKTATQVTNPSAANDEGITALHNAICAGHFEIVKFLVGFGCDVNAQDSDGWTPLHCAASCNNLAMVKFLVENGACLFAATLSDHETPAEKCEEDEEGFDGCSEYLYSIQEKLGILNNGEVYAVFSYEGQQNDELSFTINDKLTILRKGDDAEREWWWAKNLNNVEGYVPRNLLGLYPRVPLQITSLND